MKEPTDKLIGKSIGGYVIEALLGVGGMARVYRARQKFTGRADALKILHPSLEADSTYVARFLSEMRTAAHLSHPNIVTVHSAGQDKGHLYIAMECVRGATLAQILSREGKPFGTEAARRIAVQIGDALGYAHQRGIVHRDVKPENIMLDRRQRRAKLMDFGIATIRGRARKIRGGGTLGTYEYMAPEQIKGTPVDHRADIYALGLVLYEMLTGTTPYRAEPTEIIRSAMLGRELPMAKCEDMRRRLRDPLPVLRGFDAVIRRMTRSSPAKRYASWAQAREDLLRTRPAGDGPRAGIRRQTRRWFGGVRGSRE